MTRSRQKEKEFHLHGIAHLPALACGVLISPNYSSDTVKRAECSMLGGDTAFGGLQMRGWLSLHTSNYQNKKISHKHNAKEVIH